MKNLTLIDADAIGYICGYSYQDADYSHMLQKVDEMVVNILTATQADEYLGFIGGEACFRYAVAKTKPYKGGRSKEQPEWLQQWKKPICDHLVKEWKFQVVDGIEADDAVSICYHYFLPTHQVTVASPDKDMKQLPGTHFDFKKWEHSYWTEEMSAKHFWTSMIVGDVADGIPGLPGKGPAFADKLFKDWSPADTRIHLLVREAYLNSKQSIDYHNEQYTLLKMLDKPSYGFSIPTPLPYQEFVLKEYEQGTVVSKPLSNKYFSDLGID